MNNEIVKDSQAEALTKYEDKSYYPQIRAVLHGQARNVR